MFYVSCRATIARTRIKCGVLDTKHIHVLVLLCPVLCGCPEFVECVCFIVLVCVLALLWLAKTIRGNENEKSYWQNKV